MKVFLGSSLMLVGVIKSYVFWISGVFFVAGFGLACVRLVSFGLSWRALLIGSAFI